MNVEQKKYFETNLCWLLDIGFRKISDSDGRFVFESRDRRITVSFFSSEKYKSLIISIGKSKENKSFPFRDYLRHIDEIEPKPIAGEEDSHFINRYLDVFKAHVVNDLRDVVSGKSWIEVPIDYGIYR